MARSLTRAGTFDRPRTGPFSVAFEVEVQLHMPNNTVSSSYSNEILGKRIAAENNNLSASMPPKKDGLRLFTTLSQTEEPNDSFKSNTDSSKCSAPGSPVPPTSTWGLFYRATHTLSLNEERLLLRTLNISLTAPGHTPDPYATALRNLLLPVWRRARWAVPIMARQYKRMVESRTYGVPGILTYIDARTRWIDGHVATAAREGARQVVILGAGYDTRALRLQHMPQQLGLGLRSLTFFEVDSADVITKKRAALAQLPWAQLNSTSDATPQSASIHGDDAPLASGIPNSGGLPLLPVENPCWVTVDWDNHSSLIPALTAQGFDPEVKCVVIMEGLLPHLSPAQVDAVLADTAALCTAGSRVLMDFLHLDAFDGSDTMHVGYTSLAAACANKGAPFRSGQRPVMSAWVKSMQPLNLRITELLSPKDISTRLVRPEIDKAWRAAVVADASEDLRPGPRHPCACAVTFRPRSAPPPGDEPPLPEFYSLLSAVKVEPRLSLKDFVAPAGGAQSSIAGGRTQQGSRSDDSDTNALLGQSLVPAAGCFVHLTGMLRMLWGRDTSDDRELPPLWAGPQADNSATTAPLSPPPQEQQQGRQQQGLDLGRWKSAEWSLPAERSPLAAPNHLHGETRALGPTSSSFLKGDPTLEHAISIPANDMWHSRGTLTN